MNCTRQCFKYTLTSLSGLGLAGNMKWREMYPNCLLDYDYSIWWYKLFYFQMILVLYSIRWFKCVCYLLITICFIFHLMLILCYQMNGLKSRSGVTSNFPGLIHWTILYKWLQILQRITGETHQEKSQYFDWYVFVGGKNI